MKNSIKIIFAALLCLTFTHLAVAQDLCAIDANYTVGTDLSNNPTELCGNNTTSDLVIGAGENVVFKSQSSLLLTDGFQVAAGGTLATEDCATCISSLRPLPLSAVMRILPNPTTADAVVEIQLDAAANLRLTLFDPFGKVIENFGAAQNFNPGLHTFDLRLNDLPSGIYILQITDGLRISSRKVVKQ